MKNRLLPTLFLFLNGYLLLAQNGQVTVTLTGNATCTCEGCFVMTITGGQPPYQLLWSNGTTNNVTTSPASICGFCPGTYTVTVTNISTQQNATATGTITSIPYTPLDIISQNTAPCNHDSLVGAQDCELVCAGTTVSYSVSNNVPTAGSIHWLVSGASSWAVDQLSGKTITVVWGSPGSGSIQVFTDGMQGCAGQDFLCVTILAPPKAQISSTPAAAVGSSLQVCKGQVVDFQNLSTGDADYYEWYFSDDLSSSTSQDPQHTYFNPGVHTVTLVARSNCLCSDTVTMTVEVLDALAPTLDCVATICAGETVTYSASNACTPFSWTVSPNGAILEGGTATADSITVQWGDGPNGTISLNATACSGATCPLGGVTHIPIISDNAEIRGEERVCPGSTEVYTIEPFGGAGFTWTLSGGGTIKTGQGTNRISIDWYNSPSTATTYWLSVKYDNCYLGCGGEDSIAVKILSSFVVNGPVEACVGADGTFTAKLANNNAPFPCNWTLSGPSGNTVWSSASASASVTVPFTDGDGYYRVFATADMPDQTCSNQADWAINVKPLPAKLTGIKGELLICPGTTYTYEAEGGTAQSNYLWTVQNGAGAPLSFSGQNLNVTWNASGPRWLAVSQVSNDGLSCQSDTIQVQVTPFGIPDITGTIMICEDNTGNYSIDLLPNIDLQWQISPATAGSITSGQGTNAVAIFWSDAGAHTVNLSLCGQTTSFPVTVFGTPDPMVQAPAGLCPGATGLVQTSSVFSSYTWRDESGSILSNAPAVTLDTGNYAVDVIDTHGCPGTQEFIIAPFESPDISLTTSVPTGFCNNSVFVPLNALTNADNDYTFQWFQDNVLIPGQTSVTYSTNQYGNYTVQATNAQGCTSLAGPILLFPYCGPGPGVPSPPGGYCPGGTVSIAIDPTPRCDSFQLHLLDPNGVYVPGSAHWSYGISGGALQGGSTDDNPTFIFGNAGDYLTLVTVKLTDGSSCYLLDFISVEAVARFNAMPACPGDATTFQDLSEYLPGSGIASWAWDFGDPASGASNQATVRNPSHVYDPSGNYPATLTITANSGCTSTVTKIIKVPVLPSVYFPDPAIKCSGNAVEFNETGGSANITHVAWDFGDPASGASNDASGSVAFHSFTPPGMYTVTATTTNVYGCTASFSRTLNITANSLSGNITPAAPPAICEGGSITLSAPPGGTSYVWSDDNATTTPFLTVTQEGTYRVTITGANGCIYAPPTVNIEANAAPDALIKALLLNDLNQVIGTTYPALTICEGEDVVLKVVTDGAYNYNWSVANGNNPFLYFTDDRHSLLAVGNYTYSVTVTNPATGCTAITTPFTVNVNPKPSGFSISGTSMCAGSPNTLTYNGPTPPNWNFFWNTGQSGTTMNTVEPGTYFIRAINEFGCEARSNAWTVLSGPPVNAVPAGCHTRCKPDSLCLPVLPTVINWQWYQDGSPVPGANSPNFVAQQSGTYWAELTDIYGCTAQSDPLTLNLFDGYGKIRGKVWSDVNNNGVIDLGDTLVSGIPVILYQNGALFDAANSDTHGGFAFPNILSTNYSVQIDPFSLPPNWTIVIGGAAVPLSGCDVEGNADLLIHFGCQAFGTLQLSACAGGTVNYQGASIPAGSSHSFQYMSPQGCDSTLVVSVIATPPSMGAATLYACPGSSANYAGTNIPVGGTQNFTLTNWLGCDSIVTVNVAPLPTSSGTVILHACPGSTANYAGTDIPVGTVQGFVLQNWLGCDSMVEVYVIPWTTSTGSATLHACPGGTANYAGTAIPVGTTQLFTLQNWHGCDSIVTVNVQAWPISTGSATLLFACSGGSAMYNGVNVPAGTTQNFTLQTWHGCDSIVAVSVVALPPTTGSETLFACPGGSATYAGTNIPVGTSQNFTLDNWLGCDSVVTVNVTPWPTSTGTTTLFACPGGTATYAGTSIPVGTTQNFTLNNWLGCDSILTVNVAVWPTSTGATTVYACPGGTATYAGTSIPVGTSQNFTLNNWLGCDSILTVNVAPWVTTNSSFEASVCPGESFVYQGVTLSGGMVQAFVLQNWLGCDSTVTVTVKQLQNSAKTLAVNVCPGESYLYNGVAVAGGETRDFHLANAAGCDSTLTLQVNEYPAATFTVQAQRACTNAPTGSLDASIDPGGQAPFQLSLDKTVYQNELHFGNLAAGDYMVFLEDANNCIFEQKATIPAIPPLSVRLPDGILACDSAAVMLVPIISGGDPATLSLNWWNGATGNTVIATEAGPVWVEATDVCSTERSDARVEWAELAKDLSIVYVPNVLKPSAIDPENARFRPLFASGITVISLKFLVFDRWGNLLYETKSIDEGWDGIFRVKDMNPGVEVWYLEADVAICGRIIHVFKKGDVTVVR